MKRPRGIKQGWFKPSNPQKLRPPADTYMGSYKDGCVKYKSGLELKAFKYCDANPKIIEWALEPFPIRYVSPKDHKIHRYYPDIYIKFNNGFIFLAEIKSYAETRMPKKSDRYYGSKLQTYLINQAKWEAARSFAMTKGCHFSILTEKVLG